MSGNLITVMHVLRTTVTVALLCRTARNRLGLANRLLILIVDVTVQLCRMLSYMHSLAIGMLGVCCILQVACRLIIMVSFNVLMIGWLLLVRFVNRAEWQRALGCIAWPVLVGVFFSLCRPGRSGRLTSCGS